MLALRTFVASLGVLSASLCAQTIYLTPAKPGTPEVATNGSLEVSRRGNDIALVWGLPAGEVHTVEIYRNDRGDPKGRVRVGTVRPETTEFRDAAADGSTCWYWLKVTRPNGVVVNIGPVATPVTAVSKP